MVNWDLTDSRKLQHYILSLHLPSSDEGFVMRARKEFLNEARDSRRDGWMFGKSDGEVRSMSVGGSVLYLLKRHPPDISYRGGINSLNAPFYIFLTTTQRRLSTIFFGCIGSYFLEA